MRDEAWQHSKIMRKAPKKLWSSLARWKNSPDDYTLTMRKLLSSKLWIHS